MNEDGATKVTNTDLTQRLADPSFITSPYFVKSLIGSSAFSYGLYCIGACLCIKKGVPTRRSYLVSVPAGIGLFGWYFLNEDPVFRSYQN